MATAAYTEVFERKEMKFRVSAAQREAVQRALAGRMTVDSFGSTRILSLYLDTPRRDIIARSVEKPLYKEKLRVRSYGMPAEDTCVFVELKKKFKGIVYKRRVGISRAAAQAWLSTSVAGASMGMGMGYEQAVRSFPLPKESLQQKALSARSLQIAREIDAFVARSVQGGAACLEPSMLIACNRVAWKPEPAMTVDGLDACPQADVPETLRITFDSALGYRDYQSAGGASGASAAAGVGAASVDPWGKNALVTQEILPADESIMEIKCSGALPLWLVRILSENRIYKTSFSKYGTAYEAVGR